MTSTDARSLQHNLSKKHCSNLVLSKLIQVNPFQTALVYQSLYTTVVPISTMASSDALPEKVSREDADLRVVSLQGLMDGEQSAQDNLLKACTDLGFFYLDCRDVDSGRVVQDVQNMYTLAKAFYDLPQEKKNEYFVDRDHDEDLVFG